jgi:hypothetical protein
MLFRDTNGNLVELNRYDFKTDKLYYQKIMEIKQLFTKSNKNQNYSDYVIQLSTKGEKK